jgi:pimeloyl-ACP methyl ester carboxylesterase
VRTEILHFANDRGQLEGIYTTPEERAKAIILLVPGSGPATRDGITRSQYCANIKPPFEAWSDILLVEGYASFRYDKRAATYSDAYLCGLETCNGLADEYTNDLDDAITALGIINQASEVPLVLVGHSLGGIAVLTHAIGTKTVNAVATIGSPILDVVATLKQQLKTLLPKDQYTNFTLEFDHILSGEKDDNIMGLPPIYWRDYSKYSLESILCQCPSNLQVLLLHGASDELISSDEFLKLRDRFPSSKNLSWVLVPKADHFLRIAGDIDQENSKIQYNLDPLLDWLKKVVPFAS